MLREEKGNVTVLRCSSHQKQSPKAFFFPIFFSIFYVIYWVFEKCILEPERWLSDQEHWLSPPRTRFDSQHPYSHSQRPIIPVPGNLTPSSGPFWYCMHTVQHTYTHTHIQIIHTQSQTFVHTSHTHIHTYHTQSQTFAHTSHTHTQPTNTVTVNRYI